MMSCVIKYIKTKTLPLFSVIVILIAIHVMFVVRYYANLNTWHLNFTRDEMLDVSTYYGDRTEGISVSRYDLLPCMLFERLESIADIKQDSISDLTPLYTLSISLADREGLEIRGYDTNGTITEIYYQGKLWRTNDRTFERYILHLCKEGLEVIVSEKKPMALMISCEKQALCKASIMNHQCIHQNHILTL